MEFIIHFFYYLFPKRIKENQPKFDNKIDFFFFLERDSIEKYFKLNF